MEIEFWRWRDRSASEDVVCDVNNLQTMAGLNIPIRRSALQFMSLLANSLCRSARIRAEECRLKQILSSEEWTEWIHCPLCLSVCRPLMLFYLAADSVWRVAVLTNWDQTHIKIFEKEIYLLKADRKVPDIDRIWNLLRFTICYSLKLIKHSLLAKSKSNLLYSLLSLWILYFVNCFDVII